MIAQTKESIELCLAIQENSFSNNKEAENALDKILTTIGAKRNFIISHCSEIENAVAVSYKGLRYILYDKAFLNKLNFQSNNWFGMNVLAHEVGHHLNGHSVDILLTLGKVVEPKSLEKRRKQELEADEFAAFVLAKLGASLDDVKQSIALISNDGDDSFSTHPSRDKRLSAIVTGYNKAIGQGKSTNFDYRKTLNDKTFDSEIFNVDYEIEKIDLNRANTYVNSAVTNNKLKKYFQAAKQLELAYLSSGDLDYLYYSASSYVNGGHYKNALNPYLFLFEMKYEGLTEKYFLTGRKNKLEVEYSKEEFDKLKYNNKYINPRIEVTDSKRPEIVKNIGLIYVNLGFNDIAMDFVKYARKYSPKDIGLILTEADLYIKIGDESRFAALMEEAIEQDPNNSILYYNLGVLNGNKGNRDVAISYYKKAIELDPTHEYLNLASAILIGEAAIVEQMNSLGTSAVDNRKYDALKEKRKGLFLETIPYLEQLVKINPNNSDALTTLENIYHAIGDTKNYKRISKIR